LQRRGVNFASGRFKKEAMNDLEPPDSFHLDAAQGWLELGDYVSAFAELELIHPLLSAHPDVLAARCDIYCAARKWDAVVTIASNLVEIAPGDGRGWLLRSFALHELKRTQEAFDLLLPVAGKFAKLSTIPYNLACYCARLGRIKDASIWLSRSFKIANASKIKLMALNDPDLQPLWSKIMKI